jgi:multidrug efflux pump subunit AcrB
MSTPGFVSRFNLSTWAIRHGSITLFFMLVCLVGGLFAYLTLGRAEDPAFRIKAMVISVAWPGASALDMETQVADKIERKLQELPYMDRLETFCRPASCVTFLELQDGARRDDIDALWYQVRKKLDDIQHTFPAGVLGPFPDDEIFDVYSELYALTATGSSNADLYATALKLRQTLLRVDMVDKVDVFGKREPKLFVEFSAARLAALGVSPAQIFDSLARQNAVTPAGTVETPTDRVAIRADGALRSVADVEAVPVAVGDRLVRLGDIATVRMGYEDPVTTLVRYNGEPAVLLGVTMTRGGNGLELGHNLDAALDQLRPDLPVGLNLIKIADQPQIIEESVREFMLKFAGALIVVLAVCFVALGVRTGIVAALSVPLTIAMTFIAFWALDLDFDRITLGALILSLGLLVDDAIIAIEMMLVKMEQGWERVQAAAFAWKSTAFPMLAGTLVTVAGFLPVGFNPSTAGEYAGNIFWVTGIALIFSWIVAVYFIPYLGVKLLPKVKPEQAAHDPYHTPLYERLRSLVVWAMRHRKTVVAGTLGLLVLSGIGFALVPKQFFPATSRPELQVDLTLPDNASVTATQRAAAKVEELLKGDEDVVYTATYIGESSPRFYLSLQPVLPRPQFAQIVVMTTDDDARERVRARLVRALDAQAVPEARVRVKRLDFGPPAAFPIEFRILGQDRAAVQQVAEQVERIVAAHPKTRDTQFLSAETLKSIRLEIDQDRARALGVTPAEIAQATQFWLTGVPVTQMRVGIESIDVIARGAPDERLTLDRLPDLTVVTRSGARVPLEQVARLVPTSEPAMLWRRNRDEFQAVRTDIVDGVQAPDVATALWTQMAPLRDALPAGVRMEQGGVLENAAEANAAIVQTLPLMLVAMLTLLMLQLQGFRKTLFVFATAPLGLIGAVIALFVAQAPFGFVAQLGLIALAGMIMRNTIILVDQVDQDVEAGRTLWEAVREATVRRARPVVLTALAAVLAFVPLTLSSFWGPMAAVLMGGLTVATALTLIFLPAFYALFYRLREDAPAASAPAQPEAAAPPAPLSPGLSAAAE